MLFCPRCGTPVEEDGLVCPNCGVPLTKQPIVPSPNLASNFERYFSKPFIYSIILSAILIFSIVMLSGSQGELLPIDQAQQIQTELEGEFKNWTALDIFSNNMQIALISFIPVIGSAWMLFVQYNTGFIFGILAKANEMSFFYLTVSAFFSLTGLLEYSAYILALSESVILVYSIIKKNFQKRLSKQTWKTVLIVVVLLFIGGIIEAISLELPIF